jgi:hypothetical protein
MSYGNKQLHGSLLEEAILFLLRSSGYDPVIVAEEDPTLNPGHSGMEVRGRGAFHQIDAIADFKVPPPFGNPQRLLLEAKFQAERVGLPVVRNAAGVLKDVSEGWTVSTGQAAAVPRSRFHYLYALFSASDFSGPAQDYAFAHDIFLLPLRRSSFARPIVTAIESIDIEQVSDRPKLSAVRRWLRTRLLDGISQDVPDAMSGSLISALKTVVDVCKKQTFGFVTMFGGQFPAFLVAAPGYIPAQQDWTLTVRIRLHQGEWYVENLDGERIFSFDLPERIFELHEENGRITREAAAEIKGDLMRSFYAFYRFEGDVRLLQFRLDEEWFTSIRQRPQ